MKFNRAISHKGFKEDIVDLSRGDNIVDDNGDLSRGLLSYGALV